MSKKILVVDDAKIIRSKIKKVLTAHGYEIIAECDDGAKAVEAYKKFNPDLVTMDIIMPEMEGIGALEQIIAYDSSAKVIMVTAIDQRESLMKAIRLGAVDYIVKPFEDERLVSTVQKALGET